MDAIIYAAKSTDDRGGSIPDQLRQCRERASRERWDIVGEHQDENKSAYHGSRGEGLEHAKAQAEEHAPCVLIVQHSDRLARGDAVKGQHLVEVVLWAIKAHVTICTIQDPRACESILDAALMGMRNNEDSERKSKATKDGLRRSVERGVWRGSPPPGGYAVEYEHDARGKVIGRRLVKHPDDEPVFELIWRLAEEGKSALTVSLELGRRGHVTRPRVRRDRGPSKRRSEAGPRAFTADRVAAVLQNPVYAGLQTYRGELYPGDWEPYVDLEVFERLKRERARHSSAAMRGAHRPPVGYLLLGLARCGLCGATAFARTGKPRKDGTSRRQYVCESHRQHHPHSDEWCRATPWDAGEVDRKVVAGIKRLLGNTEALREQLEAGQRAERDKLQAITERAQADAARAEESAAKAEADYAATTNEIERGIAMRAAKAARVEADRARSRSDAALDALSGPQPEPSADALWRVLSGQILEAGDDVAVLNATLRESFDRFELDPRGLVLPWLSAAAAQRALVDVPLDDVDVCVPSLADDGTLALPAFVLDDPALVE